VILLLAFALQAADPDVLYRDRANAASAVQAAQIWEQRLASNREDFESAWKLARACYWLGGHAAQGERRKYLERGIEAARIASTLEPKRPEGHFWIAANMGTLAESFGLRQGLRYRGPIKDALETVLQLDPAFMAGSADRALGRWYFKVPRLFGGSNERSVEHLRRSLTYSPASTVSHYFLAETLLDMGRRAEAAAELEQVLNAPPYSDWTPEDEEYKSRARELLRKIS
jgi:tetratricopeptide (TPR) repeat protein